MIRSLFAWPVEVVVPNSPQANSLNRCSLVIKNFAEGMQLNGSLAVVIQ